jgi:hypothetical protein
VLTGAVLLREAVMVSSNLRSRRRAWLFVVSVTVLASTSIAASTAAPDTRAATCGETWGIAPIVTTGSGGVHATAASSPSDAWVITTGFSNIGFNFPVPQHWDGNTWTVTPLPGGGAPWLFGVAALDPSDAWGVGNVLTGYSSQQRVIIYHWDGVSWSVFPSPGGLGGYSQLNGIDAVSADDVWAVGDGRGATLIEHWDGTSWSIVPSHTGGFLTSSLDAVSFDAPDDGWAVGMAERRPGLLRPLLLHWDGIGWTRERRPESVWGLTSVIAIAPDDAWAVGYAATRAVVVHPQDATPTRAVAVHWDGVSWSIVPTPNPGVYSATLGSVAGLGANDVWAVGTQQSHRGSALRTLIDLWDGSSWQVEPSPNVGLKDNALVAVAAVPGLLLAGGYSRAGAAPIALQRCPS